MTTKYFMEAHTESKRLAQKTNTNEIVDNYIKPLLNSETCRFLDVGCGPALISQSISNLFPKIKVYSTDISPIRLQQAGRYNKGNLINFVGSDVNHLPFMNNYFDFVFARFLFEYMKTPETAIDEMVRVCKTNGQIMIQDIDGQLLFHYPEHNDLLKQLHLVIDYLKNNYGFDPFIGRKLYHLFYNSGLTQINVKAEPYHLIWGEISKEEYERWSLKLRQLEPIIVKAFGNTHQAKRFINDCLSYLKQKESFLYSILFTVTARKQ